MEWEPALVVTGAIGGMVGYFVGESRASMTSSSEARVALPTLRGSRS